MEPLINNQSTRPAHRWLRTVSVLIVGIIIFSGILICEFFIPLKSGPDLKTIRATTDHIDPNHLSFQPDAPHYDAHTFIEKVRPTFFQTPRRLRTSKSPDNTVEKVLSQLKLQCITDVNEQPVAYINIDKVGLRRCFIGDNVENRFTVLDIYQRTVKIDIAGEELELNL